MKNMKRFTIMKGLIAVFLILVFIDSIAENQRVERRWYSSVVRISGSSRYNSADISLDRWTGAMMICVSTVCFKSPQFEPNSISTAFLFREMFLTQRIPAKDSQFLYIYSTNNGVVCNIGLIRHKEGVKGPHTKASNESIDLRLACELGNNNNYLVGISDNEKSIKNIYFDISYTKSDKIVKRKPGKKGPWHLSRYSYRSSKYAGAGSNCKSVGNDNFDQCIKTFQDDWLNMIGAQF